MLIFMVSLHVHLLGRQQSVKSLPGWSQPVPVCNLTVCWLMQHVMQRHTCPMQVLLSFPMVVGPDGTPAHCLPLTASAMDHADLDKVKD